MGLLAIQDGDLNDSLKIFLKSDYKTHFLYQLKGKDILSRIQSLVNHCTEVLQQVEEQMGMTEGKN